MDVIGYVHYSKPPDFIFLLLTVFLKISRIQKSLEVHLMCPDLGFGHGSTWE